MEGVRAEGAGSQNGGSPGAARTTRRRARRGGVGVWIRRLTIATTPLVFNVAFAMPAFAWPECAC